MDPAFFVRSSYPSPATASGAGAYAMAWGAPAVKSEAGDDMEEARLCHVDACRAQSQLPPSSLVVHPESRSSSSSGLLFSPVDMASMVATGGSAGSNSNKQIPLLCTVCPEAPRFSDVSHLLTHIASKGHLHHETQTKLRAHQDVSASDALQDYEKWYRDNGIEQLLVERMKAKQLKEAARNKRSRGTSVAAPLKQVKKKPKRSTNAHIKLDDGDLAPEFPMFPGFFPSEQENEISDELYVTGDMMALKGQIWPGMGKMDLANEDMKRTRNQRKPKSVIERMRRTSEGIEPTQVVMTPEFEVERVKDVYDSSSPIIGQEEATPQKKATKPRRKRPEPLVEVPANVPRANRRSARGDAACDKISKPTFGYSRTSSSEMTPTLGPFKRSFDVFRDEDAMPAFEDRHPLGPHHREAKFDLHGRIGLRQLNTISHSTLVSPTPSSRDMPERAFASRDAGRSRLQGQPYLGMGSHMALGSITPDMSYTMHDSSSMYSNTARMSLNTHNQFNSMDQFNLPSHHHGSHKFDEFSHVSSGEPMPGSTANQYLNVSGPSNLFPHDRLFLGPCGQPSHSSGFPPLGFTPINRHQEFGNSMQGDQDRQASAGTVKLEPQFCDLMEGSNADDTNKDSSFGVNGLWDSQAPENDIVISDDLHNEALEI